MAKTKSLSDEIRQACTRAGGSEVEHRVVRDQEMNFRLAAARQPKPMLMSTSEEPASGTLGGGDGGVVQLIAPPEAILMLSPPMICPLTNPGVSEIGAYGARMILFIID